jgi:hypothetical protein
MAPSWGGGICRQADFWGGDQCCRKALDPPSRVWGFRRRRAAEGSFNKATKLNCYENPISRGSLVTPFFLYRGCYGVTRYDFTPNAFALLPFCPCQSTPTFPCP